jgi:hypothetical protein
VAQALTVRQKQTRRYVLIYAGLTPFIVIALIPIYWMLITAFKQDPDLYRMENIPFWFNMAPTLKHFKILFFQTNYGHWIVNTMTISIWVALITLATAVPAGYALARLRLPGAENTGIGIFMTYLVPPIILFLPLSRVVASLGLQDTWWALVVVYPTFTIPFCTWLMGSSRPYRWRWRRRLGYGAAIQRSACVARQRSRRAHVGLASRSMQDFTARFVAPAEAGPGRRTAELIRARVLLGLADGGGLMVGLPAALQPSSTGSFRASPKALTRPASTPARSSETVTSSRTRLLDRIGTAGIPGAGCTSPACPACSCGCATSRLGP